MAVGLIMFLFFFSRCMTRSSTGGRAALVAEAGRTAFEETTQAVAQSAIGMESAESETEPTQVVRADKAGVIQAIHLDGLGWAREHESHLVLTHAVGDFVATGEALVTIYRGSGDPGATERELSGMIALGDERTIQQDPAFAIRIMVDIALMALSPAVNAPTTATQVLGHLGETLRMIGATDLGRAGNAPVDVPPAVVIRTPLWEDYLALGVTEIRLYRGLRCPGDAKATCDA